MRTSSTGFRTCGRTRRAAHSSVWPRSPVCATGVALPAAEDEINGIMRAAGSNRPERFEVVGCRTSSSASVRPALLILAGRGRPRAADRLRQRGEPAARAHRRARPRDRRSPRGRRVARTADPAAAHREHAALVIGAVARNRTGVRRDPSASDARRPACRRRDLGPGVSLPRLDEIGIDVTGAGLHDRRRRADRHGVRTACRRCATPARVRPIACASARPVRACAARWWSPRSRWRSCCSSAGAC